jgi:hypothetical protein
MTKRRRRGLEDLDLKALLRLKQVLDNDALFAQQGARVTAS